MLKVGEILTINNNKYTIASTVVKDEQEYVFLVSLSNPDETIICLRKDDNLKIVNDVSLIEELEFMFSETI